ncbi:hypothetical protein [Armatimonas sp.]|uniref:hypothetical protein n=1 Tax=Armatimonas sp. TaxID=1872638 RepID=UPI00374D5371
MEKKKVEKSEALKTADQFAKWGMVTIFGYLVATVSPLNVYMWYFQFKLVLLVGLTVTAAGMLMRYMAKKPVSSTRAAPLAILLFLPSAAIIAFQYSQRYNYIGENFTWPICGTLFSASLYYFSRFLPEPYEIETAHKKRKEEEAKRKAEEERQRESERQRREWEAGEPTRQAEAERDRRKAQEAADRATEEKRERERQAMEAARNLPSDKW